MHSSVLYKTLCLVAVLCQVIQLSHLPLPSECHLYCTVYLKSTCVPKLLAFVKVITILFLNMNVIWLRRLLSISTNFGMLVQAKHTEQLAHARAMLIKVHEALAGGQSLAESRQYGPCLVQQHKLP